VWSRTFCFQGDVRTGMSAWQDLATSTAAGGARHGFSPQRILVMFQHLAAQQNMRTLSGRQRCNRTQRDLFQRTFCENFHLTVPQFERLTSVFDRGDFGVLREAYTASLPQAVGGGRPPYVGQSFAVDKNRCCNATMRSRRKWATLVGRNQYEHAFHIVKTCDTCKSSWNLNKRTFPGEFFGIPCVWHEFYAFDGGQMPTHISNKSGTVIISTDLLTDCAIKQYSTG